MKNKFKKMFMAKNTLFMMAMATAILILGVSCDLWSTTKPVTQPVTVPTESTPDPSSTPESDTPPVESIPDSSSTPESDTQPVESIPDSSSPTTSDPSSTPTSSSDQTRALVAAETNETWFLYTNKALGYSVNTPTRGGYAPMWEMKYVDQSDSHIINGCYYADTNQAPSNESVGDNVVVPDGTKFCHTRSENGEAGRKFVVDDYATDLGKKFIVIEFTKLTVESRVMGCSEKMTEAYSLSEKVCVPFIASDYQTTLDGIMGTFKMHALVADTTSSKDLEKSIIEEKDKLFQEYGYDEDLSSGYPVVFTTTTDPAVRFTMLTNSGGDAMHTTLYFINQSKQKVLQIDTDVYGGDFGQTGDLTISLNGGSAVIQREQDVDADKREITYKGIRVNKKLVIIFDNLIYKPTSALEFTVLGVSSDLTSTYFSDGLKKYSYDIVNNDLQEIDELPSSMAKPIK